MSQLVETVPLLSRISILQYRSLCLCGFGHQGGSLTGFQHQSWFESNTMWNTGPDVSEGINCLDIDKLWLDIALLVLDCMQSTHRVSSTLVVPILSVHAEAGLTLTFTLSKLDIIASSH